MGSAPFTRCRIAEIDELLAWAPVGEIWGVGGKLDARLQAMGYRTALDLKRASPTRIRSCFSVTLERTVRELNGEVCLGLMAGPDSRKQIFSSRSFGQLISDLSPLEEAVAAYGTRAAEKLRQQRLMAGTVGVILRTNPFRQDLPQYERRNEFDDYLDRRYPPDRAGGPEGTKDHLPAGFRLPENGGPPYRSGPYRTATDHPFR